MTSLIAVTNLSVRRGGRLVLRDVGFDLPNGGLVGLIGPNGAGKTSLLEALAGLVPTTGARILWRGERLDPAARRTRLFYMPDGIHPFPRQSVGTVLDLFGRAWAVRPAAVDVAVAAMGLEPLHARPLGALSKGERKRFLLGLALLAPQPLLLLDEPVDGLDLHQVHRLREVVRALRDEGRTLLLSIHEIALAEKLCEVFLLLSEGRLLASGDLASLRSRAAVTAGGLDEVFLALT